MFSDVSGFRRLLGAAAVATVAWAVSLRGAGHAGGGVHAPDDTPSIRVGVTIFADYTYQDKPEVKDADGNTSSEQLQRRPQLHQRHRQHLHIIAFRITPDITRETGRAAARSNGSYTFRLKYAFAQFNLDDWMTQGSWARFGIQQTPCVDYAEGIYRYRFQGTMFAEREGFLHLGRRRRVVPLQLPAELRRRPRRRLQRRELREARSQRPEGLPDPRHPAAVRRKRAGPARPAVHRLLRRRQLRQERRAKRAASSQRRSSTPTSTPASSTCDTKDQTSATKSGTSTAKGWSVWATPKSHEGLGGAAPLRPPRARTTTIDARSASARSSASPTGSRIRATSRRRCCSTTTTRRSTNFTPAQPTQTKIAVHALVNF